MYYRHAFVAMVVFDLTTSDSLVQAEMWLTEVSKSSPKTFLYLIGNKCDLPRKITKEDATKLAIQYRAMYWECSAKTGHNVVEIFQDIARLRWKCGIEPELEKLDSIVEK
eukprot:TRINITY_DN403_c0_g1_i2.p3 TRINITY_DN403_c0_g1~~TRINITY_DN403_c0_g1_i2.p3  ORF type:complete len:110 (-),score=32.17 TRINITY_DN403_c0_g1_i2:18-347(-)